MALGTTATILTALAATGAGFGVSKIIGGSQKQSQPSSPQPLPQPPSPEASAAKAEDVVRKRKAAATQTIYGSPLGLSGEANVAKKMLLGQ